MLTQSGVFGGTNLYSYCVNDPVNHTDPTGQSIGVAAAISLFILALSQAILAGLNVYNAFMTMINSFSIGTVFAFILSLLGFAVSVVCLVFAAIGLVSEIRLALSSPVSTTAVTYEASNGVQGSAAKTYTSPDKYVGETATAIEARYPGSVEAVNLDVYYPNGVDKITEIDILTNKAAIQVKSGEARRIFGQMGKTTEATTQLGISRMPVAYLPDLTMTSGRVHALQRAGYSVFTELEALLAFLGIL